ncbi:MAG: flavin reductase family protein [Burkholderiaceae bacterium]
MDIDCGRLDADRAYKLLVNLVVPRPIAWVTTLGRGDVVNAAPFSVFNMVGEDPPLVMISVNKLPGGRFKDTARNILDRQQFVVHIADEACTVAMDITASELPPEQSETVLAGLHCSPSRCVAPPRITEAPVAFECTLWETLESASRYVFFGRILWLHAREGLIDTDNWRIRYEHFRPVGRFGAGQYVRLQDRFVVHEGRCRDIQAPGAEG